MRKSVIVASGFGRDRLSADGAGDDAGEDLVMVSLPSVQRFISEARTTSDVASASAIYSELAGEVVRVFERSADRLVLPAMGLEGSGAGMPNRVVALFPAGAGVQAARAAGEAVRARWRAMVEETFKEPGHGTQGFPVVQWVCVPSGTGGYPQQWARAQRLLAARRRTRDFAPLPDGGWRQRDICSLSPRWPAEPGPPRDTPKHDRDARLSTVGWVKRSRRRVQRDGGFPSTASIASAPYRKAVLERLREPAVAAAVRALETVATRTGLTSTPNEAVVSALGPLLPDRGQPGWWLGVNGGPWVYPGHWTRESLARESDIDDPERFKGLAGEGAVAARDLQRVMNEGAKDSAAGDGDVRTDGSRLAAYLAVVVQDIDSMGRFLGGKARAADNSEIEVRPDTHAAVSETLGRLARKQRKTLAGPELPGAGLFGVPVYSGGDDLLLFAPARTALAVAEAAHAAIPRELPTASTAVLYFHYHASIQQAMSTARQLLDEGKEKVPGKHALAVGYLRRSGAREASIQPWPGPDGGSSAALFRIFARDAGYGLSPRLAVELERDATELDELLGASDRVYEAELARLIKRHAGDDGDRSAVAVARALSWLGRNEAALDGARSPHVAAKVGAFLRQEAR